MLDSMPAAAALLRRKTHAHLLCECALRLSPSQRDEKKNNAAKRIGSRRPLRPCQFCCWPSWQWRATTFPPPPAIARRWKNKTPIIFGRAAEGLMEAHSCGGDSEAGRRRALAWLDACPSPMLFDKVHRHLSARGGGRGLGGAVCAARSGGGGVGRRAATSGGRTDGATFGARCKNRCRRWRGGAKLAAIKATILCGSATIVWRGNRCAAPTKRSNDGRPPMRRRAVAVLGGAFAPFHRAHLQLAKRALRELPVASAAVIPNGCPPHRPPPTIPWEKRVNQCRTACRGVARLRIGLDEPPDKTQTTVATLLRRKKRRQRLILLLGRGRVCRFCKMAELAAHFKNRQHCRRPPGRQSAPVGNGARPLPCCAAAAASRQRSRAGADVEVSAGEYFIHANSVSGRRMSAAGNCIAGAGGRAGRGH